MTRKQTVPESQTAQRLRFEETARRLSADEDEAAFKAKLMVIARRKPRDETIAPNSTAKIGKEP